ncbi:hypothetical protein KY285_035378 [Solanum tuberosum]|nr:hypothetical protein KY285_035378 [Solanum tuberosum]
MAMVMSFWKEEDAGFRSLSATVCFISTDVCIEIKGEKGLGRVRRLMGWDGGLCLAAKGCWLMFGSLGIGLKKWDWKF